MKAAIVTLIVGSAYRNRWEAHCARGWRQYADKHGFELLVIDRPLDETSRAAARSPAWQKCLILGPAVTGRYDRVIWLDSDILINVASPAVTEGVPIEKIGATDEFTFPTVEEHRRIYTLLMRDAQSVNSATARIWQSYLNPADWHADWGLPRRARSIVQTGVMVLSPNHHRELLEHVYHSYEDPGGEAMNLEMRPLSFEIQERNALHVIDNRFNALLILLLIQSQIQLQRALTQAEAAELVRSTFERNYFLHLAALKTSMDEFLPQLLQIA